MRSIGRNSLVVALFGVAICAVVFWGSSASRVYRPLSLEIASGLYGGDGKTANDTTAGPIPMADCKTTGKKCDTEDPCLDTIGDSLGKQCLYCMDKTKGEACVGVTGGWLRGLCDEDCQPKLVYGCNPALTFTGKCDVWFELDPINNELSTTWGCVVGGGKTPIYGTGCGGRTVKQCDPST